MTAVQETPATPTKKVKPPKGGGMGDSNPAKAGWATKLAIAIITIAWVVPTIGILLTSFMTKEDITQGGWWNLFLHPSTMSGLTTENYRNALDNLDMGNAFVNSLAITLPATFIPLLVAAFAAYAFTFMEFWGRDFLFLTVVALLVIPNYVALVPMLTFYRDIGIGGTFPAVWLFHIAFAMSLAIYILRGYMSTLPRSVIESAKIDGASHYQTFFKLILPMSVPALASFAIFQFLWVWNDLLVALVFLGPGENSPLTVAVSQLMGQQGQNQELVTAAGMISMFAADRRVPRSATVLHPRDDVRRRQGLVSGTTRIQIRCDLADFGGVTAYFG